MREIASMIIVLSCLAGISGLALSSLKNMTALQIEQQTLTFVQGPAIHSIFADADNDPIADRKKFSLGEEEVTVFPAMKGGKLTAVAVERFAGGYGGDVGVMVGIRVDSGELAGIGVTTHKETPGLGSRAAEPKFTKQFAGRPPTLGLGDISAVSGATVTSQAVVNAVNSAAKVYEQIKPEVQQAW